MVTDWRVLNEWWEQQENVEDALRIAEIQSKEWHKRSLRKLYDAQYVREPLFAAWFVTLSGNPELIREAHEPIISLLTHVRMIHLREVGNEHE